MRRVRVLSSGFVLGALAALQACASGPGVGSPTDYQMWIHFEDARRIQSAIVAGDLGSARRAARSLAAVQGVAGIGPEGEPYVRRIVDLAGTIRDTPTFGEAAAATAELAAACGDCHSAFDGGPVFVHGPPPEDRGFTGHMILHSWAADRMWEGLLAPSLVMWRRGAEVFRDQPLDAAVLTPAAMVYARRLHELGREAEGLADLERRAVQYGRILEQCAGCHAELGINRRSGERPSQLVPTGR